MAKEFNRPISNRPARVFAMQTLYAMEITGQLVGDAITGILDSQPLQPHHKKFGMKLIDLVLEHRSELDDDIQKAAASSNWEFERMATLDRIVLRIAMVELLFIPETPIKVAISEAVQIASKFSTDSSSSFVNGVLSGFIKNKDIVVPAAREEKNV